MKMKRHVLGMRRLKIGHLRDFAKSLKKFVRPITFFFVFIFLLAQSTWNPFDIRLDTGDPPGANCSYYPQIACSGSTIYVVWMENRSGWWEIFFNSSTDGGETWQLQPTRVDSADFPGDRMAGYPQIACSGKNVFVVWEDSRYGYEQGSEVYFNFSTDGGITWQDQEIRLSTGDIPGLHWVHDIRIACTGKNVYVVWKDDRNGGYYGYQDVYFNYSNDRGMTWQAQDIRLNTIEEETSQYIWGLWLSCSKGNVYVAWEDSRENWRNHVYFNCSADFGATWLPHDMCLDVGDDLSDFESWGVRLASIGKNVYVVWSDDRNGESHIYFKYSYDSGLTWQAQPIRLDTGDSQEAYCPAIACFENNVYVAWNEPIGNRSYIFLNYSRDAGATWRNKGMNLTIEEADKDDSDCFPEIACSGNYVYIIWAKYQIYGEDIYFRFSSDGGKTWLDQPVRLDNGDAPGFARSLQYQIACGGKDAYSVWEDDRNGETDIYFNSISIDKKIIFAPQNFSGRKVSNRSLSQAETLIELTWERNLNNQDLDIGSYRIYLVKKEQSEKFNDVFFAKDFILKEKIQKRLSIQSQKEFLAEINADIYKYWHRNIDKEKSYNYLIVAVDEEGNEGLPAYLRVQ
jgi:hypothetical protein